MSSASGGGGRGDIVQEMEVFGDSPVRADYSFFASKKCYADISLFIIYSTHHVSESVAPSSILLVRAASLIGMRIKVTRHEIMTGTSFICLGKLDYSSNKSDGGICVRRKVGTISN